jgi:hypothetical protein
MAAGNTYDAIATTTIGSSVASYTFSSIPSTYTDLILIVSNLDSGAGRTRLRLNGDTGTNYSRTNLSANGSSAASYRGSNENQIDMSVIAGSSSTEPATLIININNYTNAITYKTVISRYSLGSAATETTVGLWRNTSAITSVTYFTQGNLLSGTTLSLYGIASA